MSNKHDYDDSSATRLTPAITGKTKFKTDLASFWAIIIAVAGGVAFAVNLQNTIANNHHEDVQYRQFMQKRIEIIEHYLKFPGAGGTSSPDDLPTGAK